MMTRSDDCASGLHDFCNRCKCSCHGADFSVDELKALYRILEYEYINYEDEEAHKVVNRISQIVHESKKEKV